MQVFQLTSTSKTVEILDMSTAWAWLAVAGPKAAAWGRAVRGRRVLHVLPRRVAEGNANRQGPAEVSHVAGGY